jgi:hypothetical protein
VNNILFIVEAEVEVEVEIEVEEVAFFQVFLKRIFSNWKAKYRNFAR